ncbi:VanZ family protein [Pseudogracilibacillus sp. ICA-222130]|uniref:VanZ family protein n=1 Tax=Pseudogracilibacillus sp. ICA-222130 TaxID=3134655 RepID=UPI0030C288A0
MKYFHLELLIGHNRLHIVRHSAFLPSLFNVFILLPLGVYMKYFFSKTMTVKRMVLIGFSVSLFFEITQITGLYGIYNCPYRLFDVDDLILNTLGAVIGFKIAPFILALFPSKDQPLEKAEKVFQAGTVSAMPKLLAIVIDYYVVAFVWLVFSFIFQIDHGSIEFFSKLLGLFLLQFMMPLLSGGKTIGTIVLRFTLVQEEGGYPFRRALFKRWIGLITPWMLGNIFLVVTRYAELDMESDFYVFNVWMQVIVQGLWALIVVVLCIHTIYVLLRPRTRQFYFDKATGITARYNKDT